MIKGESPAERWQVSEAKVIQKGGALPAPLSPHPPPARGSSPSGPLLERSRGRWAVSGLFGWKTRGRAFP